ncbi:MAG TPA: hypothetical protein VEU51_03595 [Candidatus Acidoferrales bacterium]|nr:hypothetical protein [Candidatus Acidoferrales bacterium]
MSKIGRTTAIVLGVCALAMGFVAAPALAQPVQCDQTAKIPRPVPMGTSGGNINLFTVHHRSEECASGTLGAVVQDPISLYVLSNNHVIGLLNHAQFGDLVTEPGLVDKQCTQVAGDTVAFFNRSVKLLFAPRKLNTVDASVAAVRVGFVDTNIKNIGPIAGTTVAPTLGLKVQKMGRTTCLTFGQITGVNINATVGYDKLSGKIRPANFIGQIMIQGDQNGGFGGPGDSGSLVVTQQACPQAVGLLFAGSQDGSILANPINDVLNGLHVTMTAGCNEMTAGALMDVSSANEGTPAAEPQGEVVSQGAVTSATSVRDKHEAQLTSIPGTVGTGIGIGDQPGEAAIEVYVKKLTPEAQAAAPSILDGVPVRLVEKGEIVAF